MHDIASRRLNLLLAIALLAFLVRGVCLWQISHAPFFVLRIGDADLYHQWALAIAHGDWRGGGVFFQAPLYPYVLALIYRIVGDGVGIVRFVHVLISTASCVLLGAAGIALFGDLGAIAGALLAVYAPAIFLDLLLDKTVLATFAMTALLLLIAMREFRGRAWLAGATLGLLTLTRDNAMLLTLPVSAWLLIGSDWTRRRRWRAAVACLGGLAIVLLPVAMRNVVVGGEFVLTTSFGPNLYIGNHEGARGRYEPLVPGHSNAAYEQDDAIVLAQRAEGRTLTPVEMSAFWARRAVTFMWTHPAETGRQLLRKAGLTFNAIELADTESQAVYAEWSPLLQALAPFNFGVIVCLAVFGACLMAHEWRRVWILYAIVITYAVTLVVFFVFARFRLLLVPALLLLIAGGTAAWRQAWARPMRRWAFAALVPAAVIAYLPLENPQADRLLTYVNIANAFSQNRATWGEAAAFYDEALSMSPRSPAAQYGVGRLLAQMNRPGDAIRHYQIALDSWPDNESIRTDLGLAQEALAGAGTVQR